jgi:hypothetical protein
VDIDIGEESNTYDYEERINLTSGIAVHTGLTYDQSEDWQDRVFVTVSQDAVEYVFAFTENLQAGNLLNESTSSDPINLEFLGRSLKIIGADETGNSITVQVGNEIFMTVGDTTEVEGHEVMLINVASGADTVVVSVDGVQETVSGTETVNGLRVRVEDTFYSDTISERSATLVVGTEATKTYSNGDEFIGEDEDDPAWVWHLADLGSATPTLGVAWDLNLDNHEENDNPAYEHPLYEGESLMLPWDFAQITFVNLNQNDYQKYKVEESTEDLYAPASASDASLTSQRVIKITAVGADNAGLLAPTSAGATPSQRTEEVYLLPLQTT